MRTLSLLSLSLLSCFSPVRLCATPQTAAHQAPPCLGFSRQEHWSGLPFPSPKHEVKSESEVAQSCPIFETPWTAAYQAPPSMGFSRQEYWSGLPLPSPNENSSTIKNNLIFLLAYFMLSMVLYLLFHQSSPVTFRARYHYCLILQINKFIN